ncbi:MAG: amino acid transporter ATPase [Anaerosolibacter sp.]|jgi:branched-chain amino acid transport system ATP-binding protein|uniref:ABC transporter ATP-binding protein n=1 Tax=Anaerosolibacter sp. TaxID=1872527 RepID=UPI002620D8E3|nr:ABC transporter ATP-binding protein [Anaerosolibacter sp.]MDF2548229.1 amino acid transporter ATPase [Anaerosolibacter sp.]
MLLKLNDVHVSYGNIKAVKGIDIEINEGEVVTLIGSNGAGKTTIMKTISGLLKPTKGKILFKGQDITQKSSSEIVRLGISLCPEGRQVFPRMTIHENLELGGYTRSKMEMNEGLEKIYGLFPRLKERMNQDAGTLSGGEQQMLAIGRALMAKPSLLLLDEPSMGLAPIMVQTIFDIIKGINQLGTTILLVEQNARMALMAADRGYLLETGKVVMTDKAENLANSDNIIKAYLGEKEEE